MLGTANQLVLWRTIFLSKLLIYLICHVDFSIEEIRLSNEVSSSSSRGLEKQNQIKLLHSEIEHWTADKTLKDQDYFKVQTFQKYVITAIIIFISYNVLPHTGYLVVFTLVIMDKLMFVPHVLKKCLKPSPLPASFSPEGINGWCPPSG